MVAIRLYWTLRMPIFIVILQTRVLIGCLAQGAFLIGLSDRRINIHKKALLEKHFEWNG